MPLKFLLVGVLFLGGEGEVRILFYGCGDFSEYWKFPNLVVWNLGFFCIVYTILGSFWPFALICVLRLLSFALFCISSCCCAHFCVRPRLERPLFVGMGGTQGESTMHQIVVTVFPPLGNRGQMWCEMVALKSEFPNLVVSSLVVCSLYVEVLFCALLRPFALICAHLRSFADLRLRSFALFLRPTVFRTTASGNFRGMGGLFMLYFCCFVLTCCCSSDATWPLRLLLASTQHRLCRPGESSCQQWPGARGKRFQFPPHQTSQQPTIVKRCFRGFPFTGVQVLR